MSKPWKGDEAMYKYFRLVTVFILLLSILLNKSLIAQLEEQSFKDNTIENGGEYLLNQVAANYLDGARKFYEKILETDSTNYDALTNLGVIYQQTGDEKKSLQYFEKAVKFNPRKSRAYHNLGILNSIMGRLDDAIVNLNKAAAIDLTSPNSVRQLGIIYLQNEMFSEAIEAFQCALKRDYFNTESRLGKALAFWSLKEYDSVLAEINEMQSLGLRFNRMELLLADVYFKKNDYEKAMKYAKLDETENSSQAEGHYLLGVLYKMTGEKDKAEFEFEEAFTIAGENTNVSLEFDIKTFLKPKEDKKIKR
ncbi:MAG: tetratricopeptide repeat protein [Ignavibacteria bacterium]|nr:tetratricopeptide repeat protein [Ignavibacteria bacterium]